MFKLIVVMASLLLSAGVNATTGETQAGKTSTVGARADGNADATAAKASANARQGAP